MTASPIRLPSFDVPQHLDPRKRRRESGHVVITVCLAMTVLIGFAGIAADVSYLEHVKRSMQTAADAGAMAGAQTVLLAKNDCSDSTTKSNVTTAAQADSALNGYTNAGYVTVTVNCPAATGIYAGNNAAVEVLVSRAMTPNFFMAALGLSKATVAARAVGHLTGGNGCVIGLSTTGTAVTISGNTTIDISCSVYSNSNLTCNGNPTVITTSIGAAGTASCSSATPQPTGGLVPIADPLAKLPAPTATACTPGGTGAVGSPYTGSSGSLNLNGTYYLKPGVYCGGFSVTKTSANVTFAAGTYIIAGGGMKLTGGTITGTSGITFYVTGSESSAASGGIGAITGESAYGNVSIAGNGSTKLTAPSTGVYAGILMYSDRSITAKNPNSKDTITGTSGDGFNGAVYFPNSDLKFSGTSDTSTTDLAIIGNTVTSSGTANLQGSIANIPGGKFYSVATLGE